MTRRLLLWIGLPAAIGLLGITAAVPSCRGMVVDGPPPVDPPGPGVVEVSLLLRDLPLHQMFSAEQAEVLGVPGPVGTGPCYTPNVAEYAAFEADLRTTLERAREDDQLLAQLDSWTAKSDGPRQFARSELGKILDRLPEYRRQVFAVEIDGKRMLYVNLLPGADWDSFGDHLEDWRERPIETSDGGYWYWALAFDPQSGQYFHLDLHGYA